jgi:hypothetical protein
MNSDKFGWKILTSILLVFPLFLGTTRSQAKTYHNDECHITFEVPSNLELRDVVGWTEPVKKIACRISVIDKGKLRPVAPKKSFDDIARLSDVVLTVNIIPIQSRFGVLGFAMRDGAIFYEPDNLSPDAKSMGYQVGKTRPVQHYAVGNGDLYVGTRDYTRRSVMQKTLDRSVFRVFLLGNKDFSIVVELTQIESSDYRQINYQTILKLLKSANFERGAESIEGRIFAN